MKIIDRIGEASMYEQLAEECCELAQAALKMSRILRGVNPTPKTKEEVMDSLVEEYGDVFLCCCLLNLNYNGEEIGNKLNRWHERLR